VCSSPEHDADFSRNWFVNRVDGVDPLLNITLRLLEIDAHVRDYELAIRPRVSSTGQTASSR
jgi:hypothetical protein